MIQSSYPKQQQSPQQNQNVYSQFRPFTRSENSKRIYKLRNNSKLQSYSNPKGQQFVKKAEQQLRQQKYQLMIPVKDNEQDTPNQIQNNNDKVLKNSTIIKIHRKYFDDQYLPATLPSYPQQLLQQIYRKLSLKCRQTVPDYPTQIIKNYEKQLSLTGKQKIQHLQEQMREYKNKYKNLQKIVIKQQEQLFRYKSENQDLRMNILILKKQITKLRKQLQFQVTNQRKKYENAILALRNQINQISQQKQTKIQQIWEINQYNQELQYDLDRTRKQLHESQYLNKFEQNQSINDVYPQSSVLSAQDKFDRTHRYQNSTLTYSNSRIRNKQRSTISNRSRNKRKSLKINSEIGESAQNQKQLQKQVKQLMENQSSLLDRVQQRDQLIDELKQTISKMKQGQNQNNSQIVRQELDVQQNSI